MGFTFLSAAAGSTAPEWTFFVIIVCFAGCCMGAVGVGGVLIVPGMIAVLEVEPKVAVASTIPAFILTAASGLHTYKDILILHARKTMFVSIGAATGGLIAAFALRSVQSQALSIGIAVFCIIFGVKASYQIIQSACSSSQPDSRGSVEKLETPSSMAVSSKVSQGERTYEMEKLHTQHAAHLNKVASDFRELRLCLEEFERSLRSSNQPFPPPTSSPRPEALSSLDDAEDLLLERCLAYGIESVLDLEDEAIASDAQLSDEVGLSADEILLLRAFLATKRCTAGLRRDSRDERISSLDEEQQRSRERGPPMETQTSLAPSSTPLHVVSTVGDSSDGSDQTLGHLEEAEEEVKKRDVVPDDDADASFLLLGTFVGFGSALSGTSGPLLLIPTLLTWRPHTDPLVAVALSMAVGVPMALAMTVASVLVHKQTVDLGLSLLVGLLTGLCVPIGRKGVQVIGAAWGKDEVNRVLLGAIASVLIATGVFIIVVSVS